MIQKPKFGGEFALADVYFHIPNRPHPSLDEQENYRNTQMPCAGDNVWLYLRNYNEYVDKTFWCLYEHWTTLVNGMDDAPDDLDLIRLVHCESITSFEPSERKDYYGEPSDLVYINVRCSEILELTEITNRFPENDQVAVFDLTIKSSAQQPNQIFVLPAVTFYTGGLGDVSWCSVATNEEPRREILTRFRLASGNNWEICNRPFELIE